MKFFSTEFINYLSLDQISFVSGESLKWNFMSLGGSSLR